VPRGGAREGAGRKAGVPSRKTVDRKAIADQAVEKSGGVEPLEVILGNMRHFAKVAADAEAVIEGLTVEQIIGSGDGEMSEQDQFKFLLAKVKQAASLRMLANECAVAAAPYRHPRLSPVEPMKGDQEFVPLADRLKAYSRTDAIEASQGKVVDLTKKTAKRR